MNTHKSIPLLFIFALAIFAGVFFCGDFFVKGACLQAAEELFQSCDIACETLTEVALKPRQCNSAAKTCEPWNVEATIVHGEKKFSYSLKEQIGLLCGGDSEQLCLLAQSRGFFLGRSGKAELFGQLCDMDLPHEAIFEYILPGFTQLLHNFSYTYVQKRDATVSFGKNGFTYTEGTNGISVNSRELFEALLNCCGNRADIPLPLLVDKAVTVGQLRQNTVLKGSFSTSFSSSGANRCHNIALAAKALDGLTVGAGETFSFNAVVGKRNEQNGYKQAKVIVNGVYSDGVGGGVCQVSTTLYNALLLSEIIPHACQHTLVSSYVMSGFDAMVSDSGADLTFTNNSQTPIYISAKVSKSSQKITFCVYGAPNLYQVTRENDEIRTPFDTVEIVDKIKYPELVYVDQTKLLTSGSDGVKTKSYLCFRLDGKLVRRLLIRQNSYKKVDKVVARGYLPRPDEASSSEPANADCHQLPCAKLRSQSLSSAFFLRVCLKKPQFVNTIV